MQWVAVEGNDCGSNFKQLQVTLTCMWFGLGQVRLPKRLTNAQSEARCIGRIKSSEYIGHGEGCAHWASLYLHRPACHAALRVRWNGLIAEKSKTKLERHLRPLCVPILFFASVICQGGEAVRSGTDGWQGKTRIRKIGGGTGGGGERGGRLEKRLMLLRGYKVWVSTGMMSLVETMEKNTHGSERSRP